MGLIRRSDITNIAKNIKEYRLKHDLKQTQFAELLGMNYQNYSKMERGVYTPSLDKLLEICSIMGVTPNDLLLEGREFDDYKQEVFENLDSSIVDITDTMKVVEQFRAKAMIAKENGDGARERAELDTIIQMFAFKNEHFWEIADFLYQKNVMKYFEKASQKTMTDLMKKLPEEGRKK